jgi:probable DNA repair protein
MLEAAGWPGETALDSGGFQAVGAFNDLLADYARLDAVVPSERVGRLHARLGRLARERVFQPAGTGARVEVLGLLEAAGQRYDRLWICGLDDTAWPPPARPNPFIPARLRRERDLPRSSPEREAAVAGRQTAAFAVAADEVVFSHAARDGDTGQAPSPLLAGYAAVACSDIVPEPATKPAALFADITLELFDDDRAPPLPPGTLRGGTRRIADQSACPFRALVHHRLGAEPLGSPPRGLDAMTRGSLVHSVLQSLWKEEGAGCARLPTERRHALVTLACARAINRIEERLGDRKKLRAIEQDRLVALVEGWLDVDRELPPGRLSEVEMDLTHRVGDHAIRLRIDRLDTLDDGRLAVVDYKTGARLPHADWGEARPREPQLPLYAAALGAERIAALAFGKVHVEGCGYSGLATEAGLLPGLKATEGAEARIIAAAEAAEALLVDHVAGNASVEPTDKACDYCGLEALCRINEVGVAVAENDDG